MRITANRLWQLVRTISVISVMSSIALTAGITNYAAADTIPTITHGLIENVEYGDCLYVPNSSRSSGTFLTLTSCANRSNSFSQWYSYSVGNGRYSLNPASNAALCMDVPGPYDQDPFERIEQWTCNGGLNQQLYFQHISGTPAGQYQITIASGGLCLDTDASGARWPLQNTCPPVSDPSQRWIILPGNA
ncbi:MAG TPA: RICIN domain-containing protein [Candidatus Saccharimonadales bacterium]|nr:RICIN domain-containing protein [Candidatus Saccharimonadales bacterium]